MVNAYDCKDVFSGKFFSSLIPFIFGCIFSPLTVMRHLRSNSSIELKFQLDSVNFKHVNI